MFIPHSYWKGYSRKDNTFPRRVSPWITCIRMIWKACEKKPLRVPSLRCIWLGLARQQHLTQGLPFGPSPESSYLELELCFKGRHLHRSLRECRPWNCTIWQPRLASIWLGFQDSRKKDWNKSRNICRKIRKTQEHTAISMERWQRSQTCSSSCR